MLTVCSNLYNYYEYYQMFGLFSTNVFAATLYYYLYHVLSCGCCSHGAYSSGGSGLNRLSSSHKIMEVGGSALSASSVPPWIAARILLNLVPGTWSGYLGSGSYYFTSQLPHQLPTAGEIRTRGNHKRKFKTSVLIM